VHLGAEIETIRPGIPGRGTVASLRDGRLISVALAGAGRNMAIRLPADLSGDGGELTDAVTLGSDDLAVASSNGSVDLLRLPGGRELRHAEVAAPGDLSLAAGGGRLLVGEGDGTVEALSKELVVLQARRALAQGIIDLEPDATGGLVAAQGGGQVVVLSVPELFAVACLVGLGPPPTGARTRANGTILEPWPYDRASHPTKKPERGFFA
jgi:hypothetical protein